MPKRAFANWFKAQKEKAVVSDEWKRAAFGDWVSPWVRFRAKTNLPPIIRSLGSAPD